MRSPIGAVRLRPHAHSSTSWSTVSENCAPERFTLWKVAPSKRTSTKRDGPRSRATMLTQSRLGSPRISKATPTFPSQVDCPGNSMIEVLLVLLSRRRAHGCRVDPTWGSPDRVGLARRSSESGSVAPDLGTASTAAPRHAPLGHATVVVSSARSTPSVALMPDRHSAAT